MVSDFKAYVYMTNFSISKWVAIVQFKHCLSKCANTYHKLQARFPGASSHRMTLILQMTHAEGIWNLQNRRVQVRLMPCCRTLKYL